MAIFQTILAALGRQVGRLLNTIFGWATTTLFGKVPQEKQTLLSVIAFGSVIWIVVVIGVIVPEAGVFMLSFVNLPEWVQEWWIRLAMLAAALILPAIIGFVSTKLQDPEEQPKGAKEVLKRVGQGYPYTLATSLALIMMVVFVPVLRIRTMLKRWKTEHLPMVVEEHDYMTVVGEVEAALDKARMPVTRTRASILVRLPIKVLTFFAGKGKNNLVADELTMLRSNKLEILLHPSDMAISGKQYDAAHARAVIAEQLAFSPGYMTWTKEANELEDRLEAIWNQAKQQAPAGNPANLIKELQDFERDLRKAEVSHEEWEVLFRDKLLVERGVLQLMAGLTDRLREPKDADADRLGAEQIPSTPMGLAKRLLPRALMMVGAALVSRKLEGDAPASPERYPAPVERRIETREPVRIEPSNGRE
ncbi:MAG: hypothetical protein MUC34_10860 [Anaerolineae bacterium]|jgi:hypothetical protein|nr:hypothetical protein [Anaerolineae bacterium]